MIIILNHINFTSYNKNLSLTLLSAIEQKVRKQKVIIILDRRKVVVDTTTQAQDFYSSL